MRRAAERIPVTRKVVERFFVAGETVPEVVDFISRLSGSATTVAVDYLGEDTTKIEDAQVTVRAYLELLDSLGKRGESVEAKVRPLEVSLKLQALGQALPRDGEKIALENTRGVSGASARRHIGAWVTRWDRRGPHHHRLDAVDRARIALRVRLAGYGFAVLPEAHARRLRRVRRVWCPDCRLCKGAYDEPASVAYRDPDDVDDSYLRCLRGLMAGKGYPMVASHDPAIIEAVPAMVRESQAAA